MSDLLRVYYDPDEIDPEGYPFVWSQHPKSDIPHAFVRDSFHPLNYMRQPGEDLEPCAIPGCKRTATEHETWKDEPAPLSIKDLIRERDGHRCRRCHHPYRKGQGQWSKCDVYCTHDGPVRYVDESAEGSHQDTRMEGVGVFKEAEWRILTVHHLNGIKHDCRWWNLISLDQRCHLTIQGKVALDRPWHQPHSEWFQPFVAGFYAWKYLDLELSEEETMERLEELLALELRQDPLF